MYSVYFNQKEKIGFCLFFGEHMKRKVILDVDTGTDDSIAIGLALNNPNFEILGITVTWGNQKVEDCTKNTLKVCHYFGRDDVKVYMGEHHQLDTAKRAEVVKVNPDGPIFYVDENGVEHNLHPKSFNLPEPLHGPEEKDAVSFVIDTLMNSDEKITIIPVGPTTNIGTAFKKCPEIKEHIEEIVFMGGSVGMGNVSPTAEANFYNDPDSVHAIMQSGVKCTLLPLNATHAAALPMSDADEFEKNGSKGLKLLADVMRIRADVSKHLGWHDGTHEIIHDALAVAYLIDPSVVDKMERHKVDIDTSASIKYGTLILDGDTGNENVDIAMHADYKKFKKILIEYLK